MSLCRGVAFLLALVALLFAVSIPASAVEEAYVIGIEDVLDIQV